MTKTNDGSERSRRKRTQLLDDLRNRRRYWELKKEAVVRNESLSIEHTE